MSTERDFTNDDPAYLDALSRLAKVLVTFSVQSIHELLKEEAGAELLLDLNLAIGDADTEFHDGLSKLARGDMCIEDTTTQDFEAEVFFGAQEAAAGKRALEAVGFDIEPRPPNLAGDNHQTVWMMAYGACPGDADTPEIIKQLEALIEPHGGMIWELGPISPEGEPAPPRLYEMMKHASKARSKGASKTKRKKSTKKVSARAKASPVHEEDHIVFKRTNTYPTHDLEQPGRSDDDLTRYFCGDTDTHVRCALCKGKAPAELMIKFKGGFVHYLCDARERIACGVGPREEQECKRTAPVAFERPPR